MNVLLWEDDATDQLHPATAARPAYAITCGSYRLVDLLALAGMPCSGLVRDYLTAIQQSDFPRLVDPQTLLRSPEPLVVLNARAVPRLQLLDQLKQLTESATAASVGTDDLAAAVLPAGDRYRQILAESTDLRGTLKELISLPKLPQDLPLFQFPHEIVAWNMKLIAGSLAHRIATGAYQQRQDGLFVGEGVQIGDHLVVNAKQGPIVLDRDVEVGPFTYLAGPVYAGPRTRILEHASLKDAVSLGQTVKIGGEVEASVIEPFTNKQHHGFLGHSYLGSWINLGAGTCNSDLKNTYGSINMEYGDRKIPTGMQFLGCIMGDYSKTAINTGIFTGKVIGVGSMLYGFVTTNVPSFVNYARLFGQVASIPAEVMIATQARMFARRKVEQRACDRQLISDLHRLTAAERQQLLQLLGS
jgi:glucose-1-phosphate thymidylyltransferase